EERGLGRFFNESEYSAAATFAGSMPLRSSCSIRPTAAAILPPYMPPSSHDLSRLSVNEVLTSPGSSAQTRIPNGRSSLARQSVIALTAAFADEYTDWQ